MGWFVVGGRIDEISWWEINGEMMGGGDIITNNFSLFLEVFFTTFN